MTTHYIEEGISVYLKLSEDQKSWTIDGPTVDGCSLDSYYEDGPERGNCECEDDAACDAAYEAAVNLRLPDAEELMVMLANALGYSVTLIEGPICTNCNRTDSQDDSCADATNGKHQFS